MDITLFGIINVIVLTVCLALPEKAYRDSNKKKDISQFARVLYISYTFALPAALIYFSYIRSWDEAAMLACFYMLSLFGTGTREIYRNIGKECKRFVVGIYRKLYMAPPAVDEPDEIW